jgi:hypothetical protein
LNFSLVVSSPLKMSSKRIPRSLLRGSRANHNYKKDSSLHLEDSLQLAAGSFNIDP